MLGTRGIWHDGWFANTVHAASPAGWGHFDDDRWELFHIAADRSQCRDLAAENPAKLEELKELWFAEADKYNGLPLGDLNVFETFTRFRPTLTAGQTTFTYYPGTAPVGLGAMVELRGMSFSVLAEVSVDSADAQGVLFKQGAGHGGHVLFIKDRRLHYVYNFMGEDEQSVSAPDPVPPGTHVFGVRYDRTGTAQGSHTPVGTVSLYVDDTVVATLADVRTHPATFGLAGASVQVGRNSGQAVCGRYSTPFAFTGGIIAKVVVDVSGTPYVDRERELALAFARD
jgi:arylsulfatase